MASRGLAWGRLFRLSLSPSAAADVAAGIVLAAGAWPQGAAPWLLIAASLCVYHGGMALNDWADRGEDARLRPDRPLPSGAVAPRTALTAGLALLVLGVALAACTEARVGALLGGVAALALVYDLAGRGPVLGPVLLGLCRAGNLGAGLLLGAGARAAVPGGDVAPSAAALVAFPVLYGVYVFAVSLLGRLEDAEDGRPLGRRPSLLLAAAAALLLAPAWVPVAPAAGEALEPVAAVAAVLLSGAGALGLVRLAALRTWTRPLVLRSMGAALRRLLVFSATCALVGAARGAGPGGWLVAGAILAGYPASYALRRVFPPS